jgi:hypothetical protein
MPLPPKHRYTKKWLFERGWNTRRVAGMQGWSHADHSHGVEEAETYYTFNQAISLERQKEREQL